MLTVQLLLSLCNIHKSESKSIDLVLAFPQADLEVDIWMELLIGFIINEVEYSHSCSYVLQLKKVFTDSNKLPWTGMRSSKKGW